MQNSFIVIVIVIEYFCHVIVIVFDYFTKLCNHNRNRNHTARGTPLQEVIIIDYIGHVIAPGARKENNRKKSNG